MKLVNEIIASLSTNGVVKRTLQRLHCPFNRICDIEQELYLDWLERPGSLVDAFKKNYLGQYIYKSCQFKLSRMREEVRNLNIEDLKDTLSYDEEEESR